MDQTVIPQFRITDAPRSVAFYLNGLGFAVDWVHQPEPALPVFMQLTRAGQTLFLDVCRRLPAGRRGYFVVPTWTPPTGRLWRGARRRHHQ